MRASVTSAPVTEPCAAEGATRVSHAARPRTGARRPRSSVTSTRTLRRLTPSGIPVAVPGRERFVCFHDLLHQLVANDVALVEVRERNPVDRADHFHRLDEARHAA